MRGHGSFLYHGFQLSPDGCLSGPPNIQGVDFLIAGVASEDRRAVGRDVDLTRPVNQRTMKVFQAGDGFYLLVGESDALDLWFHASGREIEILAIRRYHPVHDVANVLWAEIGPCPGLQTEPPESRELL